KKILKNNVIKSNYKGKDILFDNLQLICQSFGNINKINNILNYSLKLNDRNYYDYLKYGICYIILKDYKESQIMFEHSIQLNNKDLITYKYYVDMLLQSSKFYKLHNIIQIIKNIDYGYYQG